MKMYIPSFTNECYTLDAEILKALNHGQSISGSTIKIIIYLAGATVGQGVSDHNK